jgi:hypothetical protein
MLYMKQRPRIYYTESDKTLMFDRWQKGESLNSIARLFDRHHSAIQGVLARTGGIRPATRRRSRVALTLAERLVLSKAIVQQCRETRSIGQKWKLATVDQLLLWASVAFHRWLPNGQGLPFAHLSGY